MEIDLPAAQPAALSFPPSAVATVDQDKKTVVKKKVKKTSYKAMMASMTKCQKTADDLQKEKESLRNVTGGGTFSKIDKI
jgi:hypothetical protein